MAKKEFLFGLHKGSRQYKMVLFGSLVLFVGAVIFYLLSKTEAMQSTIFTWWSSITAALFGGPPTARLFTKGSTELAKKKAEGMIEPSIPIEPEEEVEPESSKFDGVAVLDREERFHDRTLGKLRIEGMSVLCTLEDAIRDEKQYGITAIPAGEYPLRIIKELTPKTRRYRDRFDWFEYFIEICDVPSFSNIYIHLGNTPEDSLGCPLVAYGFTPDNKLTGTSTKAMRALYEHLYPKLEAGEQWKIQVKNEFN